MFGLFASIFISCYWSLIQPLYSLGAFRSAPILLYLSDFVLMTESGFSQLPDVSRLVILNPWTTNLLFPLALMYLCGSFSPLVFDACSFCRSLTINSDHFYCFGRVGSGTQTFLSTHLPVLFFKDEIDEVLSARSEPTDWNSSCHQDMKVFLKGKTLGRLCKDNKRGGGRGYSRKRF